MYVNYNFFIILAGTPPTITLPSGNDLLTTAFAATMVPSPNVTPGRITALDAIQHLSATTISPPPPCVYLSYKYRGYVLLSGHCLQYRHLFQLI